MGRSLEQLSAVSHKPSGTSTKKGIINGMEVVLRYTDANIEMQHLKTISVCDVSAISRVGVKGLRAAEWLEKEGFNTPKTFNSWSNDQTNGLILRLGKQEFMLEGDSARAFNMSSNFEEEHLYPVPRYDAAFILSGTQVQTALSELCALNLSDQGFKSDAVLMTSVAGVSVSMIRQTIHGERVIRLWCDGTYGDYMWNTLSEIAQELGGGIVGLDAHFKEMA